VQLPAALTSAVVSGRRLSGEDMTSRLWLLYSVITTLFWGVWGAFIEIPEKAGFPATLGYSVWALTMVPCALVALAIVRFQLERDGRSVFLGSAVGFLGAGGQLVLFEALRIGPAYLVFPIVAMYPVITVILSAVLLHERTGRRSWTGIALAFPAIMLLSYQPPASVAFRGLTWFLLALGVALAWGVQAYVMKFANRSMKAESIFFYMMVTGIALIPIAVWMTDFSLPINWGFRGPYLAAMIQVLNAIGALTLVYAVRHGKAIVVVPLTALAPMLTVIISLVLYQVIPHPLVATGLALAAIAMVLMAE
jgi:drug/metabolite transporter (DMT)-like permease